MEVKELEAIHKSKVYTTNGRDYHILKLTHGKRIKVFGYYSSLRDMLANEDFSFMVTPEFKEVEAVILNNTSFEDTVLSKRTGHFDDDDYIEDYIEFILVMMNVFSYPLLKGSLTS